MNEIWKPVIGFEGAYEVSSEGSVRSLTRTYGNRTFQGMPIKPRKNKQGYLYVSLQKAPIKKTGKIHKLVAEAFCSRPHGSVVVNHLDGNKTNNKAPNLEWTTLSGNSLHAWENGLQTATHGDSNWNATLSNHDVDEIRSLLIRGAPHEEIARKFGVTRSVISGIRNGQRWASVGDKDLSTKCVSVRKNMENHPGTKLNKETVLEIIDRLLGGSSISELARSFGVLRATISNINSGASWAHVSPSSGATPPYLVSKFRKKPI